MREVEERVIEVHAQHPGRREPRDEEPDQRVPERGHRPRPDPEEAMVGIMSMRTIRIDHSNHPGHSAAAGTEHPSPEQELKKHEAGLSKDHRARPQDGFPCAVSGHERRFRRAAFSRAIRARSRARSRRTCRSSFARARR